MMKNKITKFMFIGVISYFIFILIVNPQNLVLAEIDEKAHVDTAKINHSPSTSNSEIKNINSERKKNSKDLHDENNKLNDVSKSEVFVENNKEWRLELEKRFDKLDKQINLLVEKIDEQLKLLIEDIDILIKGGEDIIKARQIQNNVLEEISNDIANGILPKVSNNWTKLVNIESKLENLEERYKKVNESVPATSQLQKEFREERELSFIASHLLAIIIYFIVFSVVVGGVIIWNIRRGKKREKPEKGKLGQDPPSTPPSITIKKEKDNKSQGPANIKDFTEGNLIEWWNENGAKSLEECERSLKERFREDIVIESEDKRLVKVKDKYLEVKGNWYMISVHKNREANTCYVIPRRGIVNPYLRESGFCEINSAQDAYVDHLTELSEWVQGEGSNPNVHVLRKKGEVWLAGGETSKDKQEILSEKNLIEWWNRDNNGIKGFEDCKESLENEFGKDNIVKLLEQEDKVIYIAENSDVGTSCYFLPNQIKYTETIASLYEAGGSIIKLGADIVSLEKLATGTFTRDHRINTKERGKVKLCEENITTPLTTTKVFRKENLTDWWNRDKNGIKGLKDCEDSLKKEFGNDLEFINISNNPKNKDDWYIIGVRKTRESKFYYVIPRKYDFINVMREWFSAEKETGKLKNTVSYLVLPAELNTEKSPNMPSNKGKVRLS